MKSNIRHHRIRRCNASKLELAGIRRLLEAVFEHHLPIELQSPVVYAREPEAVPDWVMYYCPDPEPSRWN